VIVCKSPAEIERMAAPNALVSRILAELAALAAPGVTTRDLDALAERWLREAGARPAFKGYRGSNAVRVGGERSGMASVGTEARRGDVLSLDLGAQWTGSSATRP
jgi:methionyl aminopeptidase